MPTSDRDNATVYSVSDVRPRRGYDEMDWASNGFVQLAEARD